MKKIPLRFVILIFMGLVCPGYNLLFPGAPVMVSAPTAATPAASAPPRFQPDDNVGEAKLQMAAICGAVGFILILVLGALAIFSLVRRRP